MYKVLKSTIDTYHLALEMYSWSVTQFCVMKGSKRPYLAQRLKPQHETVAQSLGLDFEVLNGAAILCSL
jgi:hypothetical protein